MESCKRHVLPVDAYLRELRTILPGIIEAEDYAALTPACIAAARRKSSGRNRAA